MLITTLNRSDWANACAGNYLPIGTLVVADDTISVPPYHRRDISATAYDSADVASYG